MNATKHVNTALRTGVPLNESLCVDDSQFVAVGGDWHFVDWDDANNWEERTVGFPALGAAAGMVVVDVRAEGDFDLVAGTVAVEFASGEVGLAFSQTIVNLGM